MTKEVTVTPKYRVSPLTLQIAVITTLLVIMYFLIILTSFNFTVQLCCSKSHCFTTDFQNAFFFVLQHWNSTPVKQFPISSSFQTLVTTILLSFSKNLTSHCVLKWSPLKFLKLEQPLRPFKSTGNGIFL